MNRQYFSWLKDLLKPVRAQNVLLLCELQKDLPATVQNPPFPTPLDWDTVTELCNKNQTDALLSIEIFDTDFILTNSPVTFETRNDRRKNGDASCDSGPPVWQ